MKKSRLLGAKCALLFSIFISTTAVAVSIDFEGTGAPNLFGLTTPLTNLYTPLGVTFSGVDGAGGSILNQTSGFGVNANSGTDFLAFNTAETGTMELLSFSSPIEIFSMYAAAGFDAPTFLVEAFDAGNNLLMTGTMTPGLGTWGFISVSSLPSLPGISTVKLTTTGASSWVYDDITFSPAPVPIPAAVWLFGSGLLGLIGIARRKKAA